MVLQAANDRVIPAASTRRLVASLPRPPRLRVQEGADHDSALTTEAEWDALVRFLEDVSR
ncbi:hypothetical protein GCM10011521_06240 [Arenimonas soli]|uniref:Alpha/beta hydrolase n=1 Tax=Arenimonas soli TaxID=2269504 RepID=A0ABQ1HCC9_9GAMM|nr:hypothetical protein GCM10011521_06240 [Arenimonas soli]